MFRAVGRFMSGETVQGGAGRSGEVHRGEERHRGVTPGERL